MLRNQLSDLRRSASSRERLSELEIDAIERDALTPNNALATSGELLKPIAKRPTIEHTGHIHAPKSYVAVPLFFTPPEENNSDITATTNRFMNIINKFLKAAAEHVTAHDMAATLFAVAERQLFLGRNGNAQQSAIAAAKILEHMRALHPSYPNLDDLYTLLCRSYDLNSVPEMSMHRRLMRRDAASRIFIKDGTEQLFRTSLTMHLKFLERTYACQYGIVLADLLIDLAKNEVVGKLTNQLSSENQQAMEALYIKTKSALDPINYPSDEERDEVARP